MAAVFIECNTNFGPIAKAISAAHRLRQAREDLRAAVRAMESLRDGDGSSATHYDLLATKGGYMAGDYADANAAAKASYDEWASLYGKISAGSGVGDSTGAAMDQAAAKHGV